MEDYSTTNNRWAKQFAGYANEWQQLADAYSGKLTGSHNEYHCKAELVIDTRLGRMTLKAKAAYTSVETSLIPITPKLQQWTTATLLLRDSFVRPLWIVRGGWWWRFLHNSAMVAELKLASQYAIKYQGPDYYPMLQSDAFGAWTKTVKLDYLKVTKRQKVGLRCFTFLSAADVTALLDMLTDTIAPSNS